MLLNPNEIFVFGSNLAGVHGSGSASFARMFFGARLGTGEGLMGQSYALPSKVAPSHFMSWTQFEKHIHVFLKTAQERPDLMFWLSKIGTGSAKFEEQTVAAAFAGGDLDKPVLLKNVYYPGTWLRKYYKKSFIRLCVAGSRKITDQTFVFSEIQKMIETLDKENPSEIIIVEGEAPGVDRLAKDYAKLSGFKYRPMPADWDRYPKMAGFIRNQFQAMYSTHLLALIAEDSPGTKDMINRAAKESLMVKIVEYHT